MRTLSYFIAATAAATYLVVLPEATWAQDGKAAVSTIQSGTAAVGSSAAGEDVEATRGRGGGGFSRGGGGGGFSRGGFSGGRGFSGGGGSGGRSFSAPSRPGGFAGGSGGGGSRFNAPSQPRSFQSGGNRPGGSFTGNPGGGRGPAVGNRPGQGGPIAGGPNTGRPGQGGPIAGGPNAGRPGQAGPIAGGSNGGRPPLAPELRSGLGAGGLGLPRPSVGASFGRQSGFPIHRAVVGTQFQRGRVGLPLSLPRHTFTKPVAAEFVGKWRPFVQRHWRRAFIWVAVAGIGYVTVPEFGYQKFLTFVERDEPDYAGAAAWLAECASVDEGATIVRRAPPEKVVPIAVVKVEPPQQYDERIKRFVNRDWNTPYVFIEVPRIGQVTVPQAAAEMVQVHLAGDPPNFEAAVVALEEAAAADTVVPEGAQAEAQPDEQLPDPATQGPALQPPTTQPPAVAPLAPTAPSGGQ